MTTLPSAGGSPGDGERPSRPSPSRRARSPRPSGSVQLGSVAGIPIYLGLSWFLIAAALMALLGPTIGNLVPGIGWGAYAAALLYSILLLASVFLHEFAHAWAAARYGYRVDRIVADLFGGHTVYEAPDPTPGRMAVVAFVGPASNAVAALVGYLALLAIEDPLLGVLVGAVAWTNGFVAGFNLLPGIPLDGGHVVAAGVWKLTGSRRTGLTVASLAGCVLVVGAVAWLVWAWWRGALLIGPLNLVLLLVLAWYLWQGSWSSFRSSRMMRSLEQVDLRAVLHPVRVMPADAPLAAMPNQETYAVGALPAVIVVVDDALDRPVGYLDPEAVAAAWNAGAHSAPASSCMRAAPAGWVLEVERSQLTAEHIVGAMNERNSTVLLLHDGEGPYAVAEAGVFADALTHARRQSRAA